MTQQPPPYPPDTKAKGWRFELDYESIDQSGTWALAAIAGQEGRPLLLMQWYVAWQQAPCGSLPSDESVVAALIGINAKTWAKYRAVLMRGWWTAEDGLMYHPTITKRVLEMLDYRKKTAERVAKHKALKREQLEVNALLTEGQQLRTTPEPEPEPSNTLSLRSSVERPRSKKRGAKFCPDDFEVTAEMRQWAQTEAPSVDLAAQTSAFRDWEFKDAKTDWGRAWKSWIRRAASSTPSSASAGRDRPPTAAQMAMAQACPSLVAPHLRHLVENGQTPEPIDITEQVNADLKLIR